MTMVSVGNLDDGPYFGGVCAVFVGSQVGPVCPHDSPFLMDVEGSLWFLLSFSLINWAMLFLINETRQSFCLV
jgi:hypothetical protein